MPRGLLLALCALARLAGGGADDAPRRLAVVGYLPEYRFRTLHWPHVIASTTHLVLFSIEPAANGELTRLERLQGILQSGSEFRRALDAAGGLAPKVLVSIGGAGRSVHFAAAAGEGKARRRLASQVAKLAKKYPCVSGVDLDWEAPEGESQWRDLGKLAKDVRGALVEQGVAGGGPPLVSMTYHPRSGAVSAFASIRGKKTDTRFVELFDFCNAMAYSQFDDQRRHSTAAMDRAAIEEWVAHGLAPERLALGVPFFGVTRSTGEAKTYAQILDAEPSLAERLGVDESKGGDYFANARSLVDKVELARQRGLAGVMIWEVGQDSFGGANLLQHVWAAARYGSRPDSSWRELALTHLHGLKDDHAFGCLAAIMGAYYLFKVFTVEYPRARHQPPPRPKKPPRPPQASAQAGAQDGADAPSPKATAAAAAASPTGVSDPTKED